MGKEVKVWWDRDIPMGEDWREEIARRLDDTDLFVALISIDYHISTFCISEMEQARNQDREKRTFIVPVMVRPSELPPDLAGKPALLMDKPLARWKDKEDGCLQIARKIQEFFTNNKGILPTKRLLHPNLEKLSDLLGLLCDRKPQNDALYDLRQLADHSKPYVIITQGTAEDLPERFLDRLELDLLKVVLRREPRRLSPISLPTSALGKSPQRLFGPDLAILASLPPDADLEQINKKLTDLSPISLVPSTMSVQHWRDNGEQAEQVLDAYLSFWAQWANTKPPDVDAQAGPPTVAIPDGCWMIPVLSIKYGRDETTNDRIRRRLLEYLPHPVSQRTADRPAQDTASAISKTVLESSVQGSVDGLAEGTARTLPAEATPLKSPFQGILLSPFTSIDHVAVEDWIQRDEVHPLFRDRSEAIRRFNHVFRNHSSWRMQPLVDTHFPDFVSKL